MSTGVQLVVHPIPAHFGWGIDMVTVISKYPIPVPPPKTKKQRQAETRLIPVCSSCRGLVSRALQAEGSDLCQRCVDASLAQQEEETKASEQALLLQLYRLLYSYNPDSPMGEGMKAEFLGIRAKIDVLRNYQRG